MSKKKKTTKKTAAAPAPTQTVRAAVLCPGPSLVDTWDGERRDDYDLALCVNRAILHEDTATHWCFTDPAIFIETQPKHKPALFYPMLCERKIKHDDELPRLHGHPSRTWTDNVGKSCPVVSWRLYTFCAALVIAKELGATQIDVYGRDESSAADFDGVDDPRYNRTSARWNSERVIVDDIVRWLKKSGVVVKEVGRAN